MHEVHTSSFLGVLPTMARTVWMLGFQRRRVRRWEWLTDMPKPGPLPQTSQFADTVTPRETIGGIRHAPDNPRRIAAGIGSAPDRAWGGVCSRYSTPWTRRLSGAGASRRSMR